MCDARRELAAAATAIMASEAQLFVAKSKWREIQKFS
jgi:hypothetical protein